MKMLLTLVPLTLICLLLHVSAGPLSPKMMQDKDRCCKGFNGTLIPKKLIKNVTKTFCDMEVILITTKKDKMFCYDPSLTWAQKRLSDFHKAHKKENDSSVSSVRTAGSTEEKRRRWRTRRWRRFNVSIVWSLGESDAGSDTG
ncbi:unnamed protein product [Pleuronectes platessa]|uniref:Chemokine interleukin-8-like domain-containing protein n=1 Tax=Pleuronectes platessa TaxID=8262 RepID=A0A9N7U323_PLEPL|nr:unnamed protein product [Pleuronectes platessa]